MNQIFLIIFLATICLTIYVTYFCYKIFNKYVLNLKQQNKNLEQKIVTLNKYWNEYAEAREQNFVKKLRMFEINNVDKILVDRFDDNFLTIPCYVNNRTNFESNYVTHINFQKENLIQHLNIVEMDYEHIEQILIHNLSEYLIKENFVRAKYEIRNNVVRFVVPIMKQIR